MYKIVEYLEEKKENKKILINDNKNKTDDKEKNDDKNNCFIF